MDRQGGKGGKEEEENQRCHCDLPHAAIHNVLTWCLWMGNMVIAMESTVMAQSMNRPGPSSGLLER